ncbi:DUF1330 domain-containing protein [Sphingomonas hylomeconis]|uniref:DUF1330 domain-containing protein n=1 Tax=Sphingomonas hylomeconis TaxID=1395958 RepID=A0ABV7SW15_9SPHN|nr:DUF1330 domain-containing protein [Sphingomonas hylomeconis]
MPAYLIATVTITDPVRFGQYLKGIAGLPAKFGGEPVLKGVVAEVVEGRADATERVIVSRFPDIEAAREYLGCAEYRAAKQHRLGAAEVTVRLVDSV